MNIPDYYQILGVSRNAPEEVIRAAYRALVNKYHPDKNRDRSDLNEKMAQINEAYEVLSDPEKRSAYDILVERIDQDSQREAAIQMFLDLQEALRRDRIRRYQEMAGGIAARVVEYADTAKRDYLPKAQKATQEFVVGAGKAVRYLVWGGIAVFLLFAAAGAVFNQVRSSNTAPAPSEDRVGTYWPSPPEGHVVQAPPDLSVLIHDIERRSPETDPKSPTYSQAAVDWIERQRRGYLANGLSDWGALSKAYEDYQQSRNPASTAKQASANGNQTTRAIPEDSSLRECLDLRDNAAIARCAERRR